jgi:hypothetical protein
MKSVRQTRRLNVGAVEAGGYDVNFIQTSHVKASLKQTMCRAEGRNYYLDTEMHKCFILFYCSMKINPLNRSFICVNSLKVRNTRVIYLK